MADKRKGPHGSDAARKRKAPTIDLTATDVTPPQPPVDPAPEPMPEPPPEPAAEPIDSTQAEAPPEPPPPPEDPPQATAGPETSQPPVHSALRERPAIGIAAMLLAGVAGGAIVAVVAGGLWYGGVLPRQQVEVRPDTEAQQQIARLQQQIETLKNRPTPAPAAAAQAVDSLSQRVAQLETALKTLPKNSSSDPQFAQKLADLQAALTPLAQRLSSAESAIKSGGTAVSALGQRIDDIAGNALQARQEADSADKTVTQLQSKVEGLARNQASTVTRDDIEGLQQKLTALEQAQASTREHMAGSDAATSAMRLALAAQTLRNKVVGGAPYQAELAQAKTLGADAGKLAALAPFAASGIPSAAMLSQQLRPLLPQMQKIAAPRGQASGSFLERLQANAGNLVRISPVNAPSGDRPADVLARLEVEAAHNDIAAAAADIGKLPEDAQAPAKDWHARVTARQAALAAAADLADASARDLAPRPR
jgi:hypothetical protein